MAIIAFLYRSPVLLNRGPGGPLCWGLAFSTASYHQLIELPVHRVIYLFTPTFFLWASQIALIQPIHSQGCILIFLDRMHLLSTQVHFLFWTARPGSEVNIQQKRYFGKYISQVRATLRNRYRKERSLIATRGIRKLNQLPNQLTCLNPYDLEKSFGFSHLVPILCRNGKEEELLESSHRTMRKWMACPDISWALG